MTNRSPVAKAVGSISFICALVLCLGTVHGFAQTRHQPAAGANPSVVPYGLPVFSDFDSDNKLDRAEVSSDGRQKRVSVTFGKSSWLSLPFDSDGSDRGRLISGDIDNDGAADLIWISQSDPQKLVMWLGDGRGNFSLVPPTESIFRRLQTLFSSSESGLKQDSTGSPLACVPQTTTPVVLRSAARDLHISSQPLLAWARCEAIHTPLLSIVRKRGPPSKLS